MWPAISWELVGSQVLRDIGSSPLAALLGLRRGNYIVAIFACVYA